MFAPNRKNYKQGLFYYKICKYITKIFKILIYFHGRFEALLTSQTLYYEIN